MSARRLALVAILAVSGCGQRLVDGQYLGDAAIRLDGILQQYVVQRHGVAGAVWLGYSGLLDPLEGAETTPLPLTVNFPPAFTFDVIGAPPSTGQYVSADDRIVPAEMRIARLVVIDDVDGNDAFALTPAGDVAAPDRLLAVAERHALVYIAAPPPNARSLDSAHLWLSDWEAADVGYHLVQLDGDATNPDGAAHIVDAHTQIPFTPPLIPPVW